MLFLCVLSIFQPRAPGMVDFHFLSSYGFSAPTLDMVTLQHRPAERISTGQSSSPFSGPQTLTPDRRSSQTDPHPGQTLTPDRRSPQTDPHPRQTLTPDRPSNQTDPHPRQMLTPDPHPSCSKSRHHGDRAPPADSSQWWPGQKGLWAESPSPKSSFCEIRFCPSVHCSQMSAALSGRS